MSARISSIRSTNRLGALVLYFGEGYRENEGASSIIHATRALLLLLLLLIAFIYSAILRSRADSLRITCFF